jgi:hypothetical protein
MSFINFNKREDHSADYSVKMVKEALLAIESKNINKVNSLLEGFTDNLRLDEALNLFSNKLNAINALDAAKLNNIEQVIEANSNLIKIKVKGKQIKVDINTIEVDGIDTRDYPDFVDAFFSYAEDHKGKELSDDELDVLTDENPDLINELIFDQQLYAGLIIAEGKSINKIQKEWAEVTADMASTVKVWKTAEGETKTQLLEKLRALNLRKKELEQELDVAVMGKDRNTELSGAFESNMAVNEWGSSDQSIFLDSMHKDAGKPKKMPSPFDDKLRQAAEDAVDFYWDEWPEYKKDRNALVDDAVRSYLRKYFKNDFEMLTRMFEKEDNGSVITEAKEMSKKEVRDLKIKINNARTIGKYFTKDEVEFLQSLFESVVNEKSYNKKSLMKAMKADDGMIQLGNGEEYIIYAYDNGNDDNDAMWGDDTIFALDQDGEEHEIKYSDIVSYNESAVTENYEVIYSDGVSAMKKFRSEKQALDFMKKEIASNKKLRDIAVYKPGMHSTTQTELVVKFWGDGSYLDNVSKRDKDLASKKLNEASLSKVHKAAKQGSYPAVIVVIQDGKVIHQEPVSTPEVAPAAFNVMQKEYPKALLHLEDRKGKRLFSESFKLDEGVMGQIDILAKEARNVADFTKKFFKEFGDKIKKSKESLGWVESLYDDIVFSHAGYPDDIDETESKVKLTWDSLKEAIEKNS